MRSTHARHEFDEKAGGAMTEEEQANGSGKKGGDGARKPNPENGSVDLLSRFMDAIGDVASRNVTGLAESMVKNCALGQVAAMKLVLEALKPSDGRKKTEEEFQSLAEVLWKAVQEQDDGELAS
jgi:hypothetical protein